MRRAVSAARARLHRGRIGWRGGGRGAPVGCEQSGRLRELWISDIRVQPDCRIIVGGDFTDCSDLTRYGVARVNGDGRLLRIHAPRVTLEGALEIPVSGISGQGIVLEATDSLSPILWREIARGRLESGWVTFRVPDAAPGAQRYFRAMATTGGL